MNSTAQRLRAYLYPEPEKEGGITVTYTCDADPLIQELLGVIEDMADALENDAQPKWSRDKLTTHADVIALARGENDA